MARPLLKNSTEKNFPFLTVSGRQKDNENALTELLIHASSVLECIDFDELLEPLSAILLNPEKVLVSRKRSVLQNFNDSIKL